MRAFDKPTDKLLTALVISIKIAPHSDAAKHPKRTETLTTEE